MNIDNYLGKNIAIQCETKEEAIELGEFLHNNKRRWLNGEWYLNNMNWDTYEADTCYNLYRGTFGNRNGYLDRDFIIYKYKNIAKTSKHFISNNKIQNMIRYGIF